MKISIDLSGYIRPGGTEKQKKMVQAETAKGVLRALLFVEPVVVKETPVNTGVLRNSITHDSYSYLRGKAEAGEPVIGRVHSPLIYAPPVEFGSKPHFPPIGPIRLWVKRKLGLRGKEGNRIAYLVQRKIGLRGTDPREMFKKAYEGSETSVKSILYAIAGVIVYRWNEG